MKLRFGHRTFAKKWHHFSRPVDRTVSIKSNAMFYWLAAKASIHFIKSDTECVFVGVALKLLVEISEYVMLIQQFFFLFFFSFVPFYVLQILDQSD